MYLPVPNVVTDLAPNAFSTGAGNAQSRQLLTEFDIFPRNEWNQLFLRHGENPRFKTILMSLGFNLPNSKYGYGHYEKPWSGNNVTIKAVVSASGGAGQSHTVDLAVADHFDTGQSTGATGLYGSLPITGQIWQVLSGANAGVQGYLVDKDVTTAPTAHQLEFKPVDGTVDLATIFTAGVVLMRVGNAHGEGTGLPAGETPRVIKYSNKTQIIKNSALHTGSGLTVETQLLEGQNWKVAIANEHFKRRHEEDCSNALLWGQQITNTGITATSPKLGYDVQVEATEGFITALDAYSQEDTFTSGAFALDDMDDLSLLLLAQWSEGNTYMTMEGFSISQQTENVLIDSFQQNLAHQIAEKAFGDPRIDYTKAGYFEPKDFVAEYGYRAIKKGGCTYFMMTLPEFTSPVGAGATGSDYPEWRLVCPLDFSAKDEQGNMMPSFGYRYQSLGNLNREMMLGKLVGAGASNFEPIVNEYDCEQAYFISDIGFHIIAPNQFGLQKPA